MDSIQVLWNFTMSIIHVKVSEEQPSHLTEKHNGHGPAPKPCHGFLQGHVPGPLMHPAGQICLEVPSDPQLRPRWWQAHHIALVLPHIGDARTHRRGGDHLMLDAVGWYVSCLVFSFQKLKLKNGQKKKVPNFEQRWVDDG